MVAYVIVEPVDVSDAEAFQAYRPLGAAAVKAHQGLYAARGADAVPLEGDWTPQKLTLLQFPSLDLARGWYNSPEYRAAREVRAGAARLRLVAFDGTGA